MKNSARTPSKSYRHVEEDWRNKWIWAGADPAKIDTALDNMKASTALRSNPDQYDTVTEYGPGHWVFEFEALGPFAKVDDVRVIEPLARRAATTEDPTVKKVVDKIIADLRSKSIP